ncbi:MAG: glycosyltransferase [Gemmatimonadetes bacterium]|jgi:glycosyltransferase involved in cell wall biosynthesis|nr:glycosyltransferase [Gemmatimonadota bacterium]
MPEPRSASQAAKAVLIDAAEGTRPTFSVLIATYNQAEYIEETLDSVAAQSYPDFELVIVDDGSTDCTAATISSWIKEFRQDRPIRTVFTRIANAGQSAALEHGFGFCTGEYICLLDSDDRWLPEKLTEVHRLISTDPAAGMVQHPLYVIDAVGSRTGDVRPKRARLSEGDLRDQMRRTTRFVGTATSGLVIRGDIFRALLPMATRGLPMGADSYLTFGATLLAPVRVITAALGEYRLHPEGQYLRRMMSAEGLNRTLALQQAITRHFGLEEAAHRNSYFARNVFAAAKLEENLSRQLRSFVHLAAATAADNSFALRQRLLLLGYWAICLVAPRKLFLRLWQYFLLRHTGLDGLPDHPRPLCPS